MGDLRIRLLFFLLGLGLFLSSQLVAAVQDDANLLLRKAREEINRASQELQEKIGVTFLFKTESKSSLAGFEDDVRREFADFIKGVPKDRGVLLYLQIEEGTLNGRINFSSGYGLRGAMSLDTVRSILREKILLFRQDLSNQASLVEGIRDYFTLLEEFSEGGKWEKDLPEQGMGGFLTRGKILWLFMILFVSLCIVTVIYVYSKGKCPRCGSRVHVNFRPMYQRESGYKRIKIIKCFDCNYFRKYLF